ncbi:MAG: D-glycero-beta-D-manno-heptose-7-phosphate kinase [bacterium]
MKNMLKILEKFKNTPILVVGDLMIDKFIWGEVSRISPEAPVPVLETIRETWAPGGSGNVVQNLASLGLQVYAAGVIGADRDGATLIQRFKKQHIHVGGIVADRERPTIIKSRIIARNQQVLRLDVEKVQKINAAVLKRITSYLHEKIPLCNAVIISDYGKGVVTKELVQSAIKRARSSHVPIMVDPKIEHFQQYKNITCMTPNLNEAQRGMNIYKVNDKKALYALGAAIVKKLNCESVLITRGEHGMDLFQRNKNPKHIPVTAREVFDVTGAGDTVISVLTAAIACGADLVTASILSSYAAGCVVAKVGTAPVTIQELSDTITRTSP